MQQGKSKLHARCAWQASQPSAVTAGNVGLQLSERSYGLYLVYSAVIASAKGQLLKACEEAPPVLGSYAFFFCAGLLIIGFLVCVKVTYRAIQLPGIQMKRRWIAGGPVNVEPFFIVEMPIVFRGAFWGGV